MDRPTTRRTALGLLAAAALPPCRPAAAQASGGSPLLPGAGTALPARLRFRTVAVDTAPLARLGSPATADLVGHVMGRKLHDVFADLIAPGDGGGATLVARISSITLVPYVSGRSYGGRSSGGGGNDNIEGVGIVRAGGRVLTEVPVLTVLDPGYSGAWYLPDIDALRVDSICHQFAYWLRREMGV